MKIIIPMAGMGKRLRPFTLTTPKPLIKIAGKSIVERLVEKIINLYGNKVTDVGFVIGDFPESVNFQLKELGKKLNFKTHIFYQKQALGTAHAIFCAEEILSGEVVVAFADTLFDFNGTAIDDADVVIWTKAVNNPESYGVVIKENDKITGFEEKPEKFVSDEAIIGIYYFKNGELLKEKLKFILDNDMKVKGEYLLTDALQMLLDSGLVFKSQLIDEWLDCGNKNLVLNTMSYVISHEKIENGSDIILENSVIIEPVYIGNNVEIKNSVIGPYVSLEDNSVVKNSIVRNSILLEGAVLDDLNVKQSMFGNNSSVKSNPFVISAGDYDEFEI